jgi:inorganic pyrophosphatase
MTAPAPFFRSRPHPWHGLDVGEDPPVRVNAYIELTPFDYVKYEIDKKTGYLVVDRPQRTSSQPPTLYGFIPRTFCGPRTRELSPESVRGDRDPLDICVLSERPIDRSEVILRTRVIGGIQMVDDEEADDKIIAVLENDDIWSEAEHLSDIPEAYVERLRHYFSTYKLLRGKPSTTRITDIYDLDHARKVVEAAMADYEERYEF